MKMADTRLELYAGSRLFDFVTPLVGFPIDQVNFFVCQLSTLLLGLAFRHYLMKPDVSATNRHIVSLAVGLFTAWFCFGHQIIHIIMQALIGYLFIAVFRNTHWFHFAAFATSLAYLSFGHLWRMAIDYCGYTLDITGPLMLSTQKIAALAFSIHDGKHLVVDRVNGEKTDINTHQVILTKEQQAQAIRNVPSALEYFSYIFFFPAVMVGPLCFYKDFQLFMECKTYENNNKPSPHKAILHKLFQSLVASFMLIVVVNRLPISRNMDPDFITQTPFIYRFIFLLLSCTFARMKYYIAWTLADAANNACGLGFTGFDLVTGDSKWDLVTNVNIYKIETATSWKVFIEQWNIQTTTWLRLVCYDRFPAERSMMRTMSTYVLSSIWHGFYPGYYLVFITGAALTMAGRKMRRLLRPLVLSVDEEDKRRRRQRWYDVATFLTQNVITCYTVTPFELMEGAGSWRFYSSMYFYGHLILLIVFLVLPSAKGKSS